MKIKFPFETRQAMQVATAIAASRTGDHRSVLLGIYGGGSNPTTTFRFEGGLVVKVCLSDVGEFNGQGPWRRYCQCFVVTSAQVITWAYEEGERVRASEVWGPDRLRELRESPVGWWHPHVMDAEEVAAYDD